MLTFRFTSIENSTVIGSRTQGHITVQDGDVVYSSSDTAQEMFLCYALFDLLSGVFAFLNNDSDKQYIFQSMYEDYAIKITRKRRSPILSVVTCRHGNYLISQPTPEQLRAALWQGVEQMCDQYVLFPEQAEEDATDRDDMRTEFNALLQRWTGAFPELRPLAIPV